MTRFEVELLADRIDRTPEVDRQAMLDGLSAEAVLLVGALYSKQCHFWPPGQRIRDMIYATLWAER